MMEDHNVAEVDFPDFSHLPDVTWVRVNQYLALADRSKLSRTCHALYDVFSHPSLWSNQTLSFFGDLDNYTRKPQKVLLNESHVNITNRFGKYFQHLTIEVQGHFRDISNAMRDTLQEVGKQCRLETLIIEVGRLTSYFHEEYGFPPNDSAVMALTSFVKNAFRMKHLHVRSWPMFKDMNSPECNIFMAIVLNDALKLSLESLTMFGLKHSDWSEREPILLNDTITCHVIRNFNNLTRIGLRSPMLSNQLLQTLCEPTRVKLEELQIVVHYVLRNAKFHIPTIDPRTWQALVARNPDFRVECTIMFDTPVMELSNILSPEVPLSALTYMKYSKISENTLVSMYSHYNATLTKFHCFCDARGIDEDLMELATKCENLTEFLYHGEIQNSTVVALAKTKGPAWTRFEIKETNIKIRNEFDDIDEDQVIARQPDGQYVLVGLMRFHQPEETRQQVVDAMATEVSKVLECPWKPLV